jgi:hypothetical protein
VVKARVTVGFVLGELAEGQGFEPWKTLQS